MTEQTSEKLSAERIQSIFDQSPFISLLGLKVVSIDHATAEIVANMPMRAELERRPGTNQFHGGPIASFIDTIGDFAIGMLMGGGVPTINLRVDYLRPAIGNLLVGTARVRKAGKAVALVDVDVSDENGKLVAVGRGTYSSHRG